MRLIVFMALLMFSGVVSAQEAYAAENAGWMVSLDKAYAESQKTGKPIMANFTGSDWCGWCKRLTRDVFSKDEFKAWAKDNVILLELDFPRRKQLPTDIKRQNSGLQQAFKVRGYPTVWLFDLSKDKATGQYNIAALGRQGYNKSVKDFISGADQMIAKREKNGS